MKDTFVPPEGIEHNYQPAYSTTLKAANGGKVWANADLVNKKKFYGDILFGKLTDRQERIIHHRMLKYWSLCWATIILNYIGYLPLHLTCLLVIYCCINHVVVGHDNMHLRSQLPFHLRLVGFGLWGLHVACTYGDNQHEHVREHHLTKGVFDRSEHDFDTLYSDAPLWKMIMHYFFNPSHTSAWDIVFHQYVSHPSSLWPERVAVNIVHWAQLYLLWQTDIFWAVLFAGHIGMFLTWTCFHGLIHRPSFFKLLLDSDPSGGRQLHPIVEGVCKLISKHAWMEMKWHDVHHSHGFSVLTYAAQEVRGYSLSEIEEALADLVDDGLFLDSNGKAVSPLAEVGHRVGSRKKYLAAQSCK